LGGEAVIHIILILTMFTSQSVSVEYHGRGYIQESNVELSPNACARQARELFRRINPALRGRVVAVRYQCTGET
jgi:hypothetical protein